MVVQDASVVESLWKTLSDTRVELADAEASARELRIIVQALEFTLERMGGRPGSDERPLDWTTMSRRQAIIRVLEESGEPTAPKDIIATLHAHGRNDVSNHVHATLSRLKDGHKIESKGYGLWGLPEAPDLPALLDGKGDEATATDSGSSG